MCPAGTFGPMGRSHHIRSRPPRPGARRRVCAPGASQVTILVRLSFATGMCHGAFIGGTDKLSEFPDSPRGVECLARGGPVCLAARQLLVRQIHAERPGHSVDGDHIAVLEETDWPAKRGFGADMADAEAA